MGNKLKKLATNSLNAAAEATSSSSANRKDQRDEPKASPEDRQQQLKQEEDGTDNQVCALSCCGTFSKSVAGVTR